MTDTTTPPGRKKRTGTIPEARAYCGIGRSSLYDEAAKRKGLFVKWGNRTLVDFDVLDQILDALPPAEIKPLAPRKPAEIV